MSGHEFHLMHRKLLALGSLAQYSLQRLLYCLSLESTTVNKDDGDSLNDHAAKAVSDVLSRNLRQLKNISFSDPSKKGVIYKTSEDKDLNEKIHAEFLDTPALVGLLLRIKTYPVSYPKNRASVTCSKHGSSGQVNVQKCSQQPCQFMCDGYCANTTYICCEEETCRMCLNCTLENLDLKDWQELVKKLVLDEQRIGNVCQMLLLRLSIVLIKIFRNFMCHLTTERCKEIDKGIINKDIKIPSFCRSWSNIQDVFQFAIEQVLGYLKWKYQEFFSNREFDQQMEFMRNITTATQQTNLDKYDRKIHAYLKLEQFRLEHSLAPTNKSIKVLVKFEFKDSFKEFDLTQSDKFDEAFKNATESYFQAIQIGTNNVTAQLEGEQCEEYSQDHKSFRLAFLIQSKPYVSGVDLTDYKKYCNNQKAKELWGSLEEELKEVSPPNTTITLKSWGKGSVIINVTLSKTTNEDWREDEIIDIEEEMKILANRFNLDGDLSQCTMTFKSRRKTLKDRLPTCNNLVFRLDAFSKEMVKELENFDKKRFIVYLQENVSCLEEEVTVRGIIFPLSVCLPYINSSKI